jgi:hypothetical protein
MTDEWYHGNSWNDSSWNDSLWNDTSWNDSSWNANLVERQSRGTPISWNDISWNFKNRHLMECHLFVKIVKKLPKTHFFCKNREKIAKNALKLMQKLQKTHDKLSKTA